MELYIFRHGRTVWNADRRIQGSADIDLTEEGRKMAQVTAEAIRDIHFDAIYASPLRRAYETACILKGDRALTVIKEPRIRELNFGVLEGTSFENIQNPEAAPDFGVFFTHPELYQRPLNGESLEELCARTADFIEDIKKKHKNSDRIMIVAHGAANKAMLKYIRGLDMKDLWYGNLQKNCGAVIVELAGETYHIVDECRVFYGEDVWKK